MEVVFYMSPKWMPKDQGIHDWFDKRHRERAGGGGGETCLNWILQTYLELENHGVPDCRFTTERPTRGIVIAMEDFVPPSPEAAADLFFCNVVADGSRSPVCQFAIHQNPRQVANNSRSIFMPHWPQPGLKPRDPSRQDAFEVLSYFGHEANLAPEFKTIRWQEDLKNRCGMQFRIPSPETWWDFSGTDCCLAVRPSCRTSHLNKPASKLYNAWLGDCILIGGTDSAYEESGKPGVNYLQASSANAVLEHLERLKADPRRRRALVEEGRKAGRTVNTEATRERWKHFVQSTVREHAARWFSHPRPIRQLSCLSGYLRRSIQNQWTPSRLATSQKLTSRHI